MGASFWRGRGGRDGVGAAPSGSQLQSASAGGCPQSAMPQGPTPAHPPPAHPPAPHRTTGIKPQAVDILIVNCSLFNPTPSLSGAPRRAALRHVGAQEPSVLLCSTPGRRRNGAEPLCSSALPPLALP